MPSFYSSRLRKDKSAYHDVYTPTIALTTMKLVRPLNLSKYLFPHLQNGVNNSNCLIRLLLELN